MCFFERVSNYITTTGYVGYVGYVRSVCKHAAVNMNMLLLP